MKTTAALTIFILATASLLADTLQIGVFTLPYRFEDTNITDIVRYVATNDVQSFCAPITAFRPPYQDKDGNICVQRINTPGTTLYRPDVFMQGIMFYIENSQTNCVIKQSLTDAAKAIENELPIRTNLVFGARQFLDTIVDGSITNRPISELRARTRVYQDGALAVVDETDCPDNVIIQNLTDIQTHATLLPLSILDAYFKSSETNQMFFVMARYDTPDEPSYRREIDILPLVFANGYWSLCLE